MPHLKVKPFLQGSKRQVSSHVRGRKCAKWIFHIGLNSHVCCGSGGKEPTYNVGDLRSIPRLGRSPGESKGYPLLYSGLENPMDYSVHGVTKSWTWLSDCHFHFSWLSREQVPLWLHWVYYVSFCCWFRVETCWGFFSNTFTDVQQTTPGLPQWFQW